MIARCCRNCGASKYVKLNDGAWITPFFAFRVFGITGTSLNPVSRKNRLLSFFSAGLYSTVQNSVAIADAGICTSCSFYSTWLPVPDLLLYELYKDYRSRSYNDDREKFEPGYTENVGRHIGGPKEISSRYSELHEWLTAAARNHPIDIGKVESALDYGGADGGLLPDFNPDCKKWVLDASDAPTKQGVVKITQLPDSEEFDFIMLAHVLEHISTPLDLLLSIWHSMKPGGVLYLEVPSEAKKPDSLIYDALHRKLSFGLSEHLNIFTLKSLHSLTASAGFDVLDSQYYVSDWQWQQLPSIRLLARKALSAD